MISETALERSTARYPIKNLAVTRFFILHPQNLPLLHLGRLIRNYWNQNLILL